MASDTTQDRFYILRPRSARLVPFGAKGGVQIVRGSGAGAMVYLSLDVPGAKSPVLVAYVGSHEFMAGAVSAAFNTEEVPPPQGEAAWAALSILFPQQNANSDAVPPSAPDTQAQSQAESDTADGGTDAA